MCSPRPCDLHIQYVPIRLEGQEHHTNLSPSIFFRTYKAISRCILLPINVKEHNLSCFTQNSLDHLKNNTQMTLREDAFLQPLYFTTTFESY